eukprot:278224_1
MSTHEEKEPDGPTLDIAVKIPIVVCNGEIHSNGQKIAYNLGKIGLIRNKHMDTSFMNKFAGQIYDFCDEFHRELMFRTIFDLLFNGKVSIICFGSRCSFQDIGFYLLCRDESNRFIQALQLFQNSQYLSPCTTSNFVTLCNALLSNKRLIKHILSTSEIREPFLLSLIRTKSLSLLMVTMRWWRGKQYKFLWKHQRKVINMLVAIVAKFQQNNQELLATLCRNNTENNSQIFEKWFHSHMDCQCHTHNELKGISYFCGLLRYYCEKKKCLIKCNQFMTALEHRFCRIANTEHNIYSQIIYKKACALCFDAVYEVETLKSKVFDGKDLVQCAWMNCSVDDTENVTKLKLCGGCKMFYYCCRDHQKRHWNLLHSLHCLRQHTNL